MLVAVAIAADCDTCMSGFAVCLQLESHSQRAVLIDTHPGHVCLTYTVQVLPSFVHA